MIKSELIQKIAASREHLYQRDAERIVNIVLGEIVDALARGDRVELRGFGAFTVKYRAPRKARNPRTGQTVFVEEKYVPFFKSGKELRERLNRNYKPSIAAKSATKSASKSVSKNSTAKAKVPAQAAKPRAAKAATAGTKSGARATRAGKRKSASK